MSRSGEKVEEREGKDEREEGRRGEKRKVGKRMKGQ